MKKHIIKIGNIKIGYGQPLVLIAGPCVIESERQAMYYAEELSKITSRLNIPLIYKSSYDKANRTSIDSFRGPGLIKGLGILKKIKDRLGLPILSDVHCRRDIEEAVHVLDVIQIPAFLCRQTDLLLEAASTGKPVNVKKGQFMSPEEMRNVVDKIEYGGNQKIILTERGTSFGYNTLINDFKGVVKMTEIGYPVVYDATHSVQTPGGMGTSSGGESRFVSPLVKAAAAVGCDGLFLEAHIDPSKAKSDGPNMIKVSELEELLAQVIKKEKVVKRI